MSLKNKYIALMFTSTLALTVASPAFSSGDLQEEVTGGAAASSTPVVPAASVVDDSQPAPQPAPVTHHWWDRFDINHDGRVNFTDFQVWWHKTLYQIFDRNGDGDINYKDLRAFFDFNGDGTIDSADIDALGHKINRGAENVLAVLAKIRGATSTITELTGIDPKYQNEILHLLDTVGGGVTKVQSGIPVGEKFSNEILESLGTLRAQWTSGALDINTLRTIAPQLKDALTLINEWKATGKTDKNFHVLQDVLDELIKHSR